MPLSAPDIANDSLVQVLDRWRRVAAGAVILIGVLVVAAFVLERTTTRRVLHSGNVLWMASAAQEAVWTAEAAVRTLYLNPNVDSVQAQAAATRTDSARRVLRALRDSVAYDLTQAARVDSILVGLDDWERIFAAPA